MIKDFKTQYIKPLIIFAKAQTSAFVGGVCDYCIMVCLTEFTGIHYTLSIAIGCIMGAVINFMINKNWSFYTKNGYYKFSNRQQIARFIFVAGSSILLKMGGTHLFTLLSGIDYKISRIITDICVSLFYNFVLQKFWVFKITEKQVSNNS